MNYVNDKELMRNSQMLTPTYFLGPLALGFLAKSEGSSDSRDFPLVLKSL